jgi:hypothetical protein
MKRSAEFVSAIGLASEQDQLVVQIAFSNKILELFPGKKMVWFWWGIVNGVSKLKPTLLARIIFVSSN